MWSRIMRGYEGIMRGYEGPARKNGESHVQAGARVRSLTLDLIQPPVPALYISRVVRYPVMCPSVQLCLLGNRGWSHGCWELQGLGE